MTSRPIKKVVIAGGGTAGWCAAAAIGRVLGPLVDVTLIESQEIGTIAVGESTIPTVRAFHQILGIDERAFVKATNATFKLGISFENWARKGDRYVHSFGTIGQSSWMAPFHHVWLQARAEGAASDLGDYCFELKAAEAAKFETGPNARINYAYHLDAGLYGLFLRQLAESCGVKRIEGKFDKIEQDADTGFITALVLESGERIEGDLFIDCTGFKALLIEQTLKTGWEDWSHWLPTDRALAVQTESEGPLVPLTRAVAHDVGWRWRIPLQTRVGNGFVYSSPYLSDDEAHDRFIKMLDAPALFEPRVVKFQTGRRRKSWNKNCVCIGLSSGFIEPLESTSIHLFQIAVTRLIQMFPLAGISDCTRDHYNDLAAADMKSVRDFIILHYKANERTTEHFWRDRQAMDIPDSLTQRIALFKESAQAYQDSNDLFRVDSWVQVLLGQRIEPRAWHPLGTLMPKERRTASMNDIKTAIEKAVTAMPNQSDFLKHYQGQLVG